MKLLDMTNLIVGYLSSAPLDSGGNTLLPNPHGTSAWIYADYPRMDVTFPRISVTQSSGVLNPVAIGEATDMLPSGTLNRAMLAEFTFDIDIWVKLNDRFVDPQGNLFVGTKLRDRYAQDVITALEQVKPIWAALPDPIIDVEIIGIAVTPLEDEMMLHRKTVTVKITTQWSFDE